MCHHLCACETRVIFIFGQFGSLNTWKPEDVLIAISLSIIVLPCHSVSKWVQSVLLHRQNNLTEQKVKCQTINYSGD